MEAEGTEKERESEREREGERSLIVDWWMKLVCQQGRAGCLQEGRAWWVADVRPDTVQSEGPGKLCYSNEIFLSGKLKVLVMGRQVEV